MKQFEARTGFQPAQKKQVNFIGFVEGKILQETTEQRDFFTIEHTYILTIDGRFRLEFGVSMLIEVVNCTFGRSSSDKSIVP